MVAFITLHRESHGRKGEAITLQVDQVLSFEDYRGTFHSCTSVRLTDGRRFDTWEGRREIVELIAKAQAGEAAP